MLRWLAQLLSCLWSLWTIDAADSVAATVGILVTVVVGSVESASFVLCCCLEVVIAVAGFAVVDFDFDGGCGCYECCTLSCWCEASLDLAAESCCCCSLCADRLWLSARLLFVSVDVVVAFVALCG